MYVSNIPRLNADLKPLAVVPYFDTVAIWLKERVKSGEIKQLRGNSGHVYYENRAARFDRAYRQRIEFHQPGDDALRWISSWSDVLINRVDLAMDFIFADSADRDDFEAFIGFHLVRPWHGKNQKVCYVKPEEDGNKRPTRYDAQRSEGAPNVIAIYAEDFCRRTRELNCLHFEWRASGARAVRSLGINRGVDLVGFDFEEFFHQRLRLREVDEGELGRLFRRGGNRRGSRKISSIDIRAGHTILNSVGSIQELVDDYGGTLPVSGVLRPVSFQT